ncbi:MAG: squalene/phytoene synthase family protein [Nitrospirae bacterium CG_4_9_14_3_um_filter_51_5]|nr:MAG: squalene/phytoene synthase family protein [Nitrospirae bacterium CG_4_9_14_3_um_filter_51_5]
MRLSPSDQNLLGGVLKRVSRSFYLTLAILPRAVRSQIGLAYLLARAADTIADTGELDDAIRLECLRHLKGQLWGSAPDLAQIQKIQARVLTKQSNPDERRLLEELDGCFRMHQRFSPTDRSQIAQVLSVLIGGMEFDLHQFPKNDGQAVRALQAIHDFEYYTYAVAGCVGEFWTKMVCSHLPGFRGWDQACMIPLGIRFGKGLQMVNILRDLPRDLRNGRCYIPTVLLDQVSLAPHQLLDETSTQAFRPLFRKLIQEARDHLDQGWRYTMAIPRMEIRLRLACMWPILIGIRTLQQLSVSPLVLSPNSPIKIARSDVYRIVASTGLTGGCGSVGTAYWGYWRKRII